LLSLLKNKLKHNVVLSKKITKSSLQLLINSLTTILAAQVKASQDWQIRLIQIEHAIKAKWKFVPVHQEEREYKFKATVSAADQHVLLHSYAKEYKSQIKLLQLWFDKHDLFNIGWLNYICIQRSNLT